MKKLYKYIFLATLIAGLAILYSCRRYPEKLVSPLYEVLNDSKTNLHFSNNLKPTTDFNMLKYMYYYNGAGVGAADFNNDGRVDLFCR
jgi:hypothetical protein